MKPVNDEKAVRLSAEQRGPGDPCQRCGYTRHTHDVVREVGGRDEWFGLCNEFQEVSTKRIGDFASVAEQEDFAREQGKNAIRQGQLAHDARNRGVLG